MKWSAEQQNAIDNDKKNILVSAAAGSGKTAVLVERVVSHLLKKPGTEGAWSVDRLLVVTFTKAAASEMSQRIRKRLQAAVAAERSSSEPDKELVAHLERQMVLLSSASISTIDSFCQSVIKNNFSLIDLDPKFRVANENELTLIKQDVMDELLEEKYDQGDIFLLRLIDEHGSDRGDDKLHKIIMKLYDISRNQPFPELWLKGLKKPFAKDASGVSSIADTSWWPIIQRQLANDLKPAIDLAREMMDIANLFDDEKVRGKFVTIANEQMEVVEKVALAIEQGKWDNILEAISKKITSVPSNMKNMDPDLKAGFKALKEQYTVQIKKIQAICIDSEESFLAELDSLSLDAEALIKVVLDFSEAFQQEKKRKNIIDYGDMEHFALSILMDFNKETGEMKPSDAALALREKYQEIMVDEYQDTNEVQDTIVSLISGYDNANVFTVGDVKQSIYGFRSSEPSLFLKKYKDYGVIGNPVGELITLGKNFRSRKEILSAINYVFAQVMTEEPNEIEYDQLAMLNPGEPYGYPEPEIGNCLDDNVELAIIANAENSGYTESSQEDSAENDEEELQGIALEAQYIAQRLKAIKESGVQVFDTKCKTNNGYRQVEWRDMVILLRATSNKADLLQEVLEANGIPSYANSSGGFFKMTEVMVMRALLSVIDNSQQDIPLAAVLYSPVGGFSADELAKLRLLSRDKDLYSTLLLANSPDADIDAGIKEKTALFLEKLQSWRHLARFLSVPELIWELYRDTGYYDYVGCQPGGQLRQANLRLLITRAREFQETDYRGLFRFLRFIERLESSESDMGLGKTIGENEDVVRIMTIHKSKGLEFPIVVLANMSKGFNYTDLRDDVLVHKELGLGLNCFDIEKSVKYPSLSHLAVKAKLKQEIIAEELRVLYVAMTRAREKLIMVGYNGNSKLTNKIKKWTRCANSTEQTHPAYMLSDAGSYMDWVASSLARHPDGDCIIKAAEDNIVPVQIIDGMGAESSWKVSILDKDSIKGMSEAKVHDNDLLELILSGKDIPETSSYQRVKEKLDWKYDLGGTEKVPAKLSVSEIKRQFAKEMAQESDGLSAEDDTIKYIFNRPNFMTVKAGKKQLTSSEYGTLMHSVMQHLDLSESLDLDNINNQLEVMVNKEIITAEQKSAVNPMPIAGFFASSLGKRLLSAENVWRELPFSRMLKAKTFYPEVQNQETMIFSQGIIDVLFKDQQGNMVLMDYKTDKDTTPDKAREKYRIQLFMYKEAVESLLGVEVNELYLYMLHDGSIVKL